MPNASAGNTISSSAQVSAGVITTTGILDGTIANADVSASAAIAGSKIQTLSAGVNAGVIGSAGIVNADINASAGIIDSKLATLSTAGKVSGAALTSLASIPSGAGLIPLANMPISGISILKSNSGVSTNQAANNLDTVAISALTALDTIEIDITLDQDDGGVGAASDIIIYNSTDSVELVSLSAGGANIAGGNAYMMRVIIQQSQEGNTKISSFVTGELGGDANVIGSGANITSRVNGESRTVITAWTGSWTLALRQKAMTAAGTLYWVWKVRKLPGQ